MCLEYRRGRVYGFRCIRAQDWFTPDPAGRFSYNRLVRFSYSPRCIQSTVYRAGALFVQSMVRLSVHTRVPFLAPIYRSRRVRVSLYTCARFRPRGPRPAGARTNGAVRGALNHGPSGRSSLFRYRIALPANRSMRRPGVLLQVMEPTTSNVLAPTTTTPLSVLRFFVSPDPRR